jgi:hypothetical protein
VAPRIERDVDPVHPRATYLWRRRFMASKTRIRTGRALTTRAVLFLLFDAAGKLAKPAPIVKAFAEMGYPIALAVPIGIILLICTALYSIPRTSVFGALLLTGFLGGAVEAQMRAGNPVFECVFPILFAGIVWGGLVLRDPRLRAISRPA